MEYFEDGYILSTGRKINCIMNTFGICECDNEGQIKVSSGYDDGLSVSLPPFDDKSEDIDEYLEREQFTDEEKREVAEYVIDLWQKWMISPSLYQGIPNPF